MQNFLLPELKLKPDFSQSLDELNKHAKNGGESVVALTAPWCGHCKALKPELNKMRSKLKGGNGIVANVSDKYHSQLDMDTTVDGFPTIRHFKGGKKVLSKTISVSTVESEIAKSLESVQNQYRKVEIGSYPFFRLGKIGVSIVLRSTEKKQIDVCYKKIISFLEKKKIKIIER